MEEFRVEFVKFGIKGGLCICRAALAVSSICAGQYSPGSMMVLLQT
jgi:ABC-type nickel/cobalt efflux system permease component RcnA